MREALRASPVEMLPLTHEIALRAENLPGYGNPDPGDRFLVATALIDEAIIVMADASMRAYSELATLW